MGASVREDQVGRGIENLCISGSREYFVHVEMSPYLQAPAEGKTASGASVDAERNPEYLLSTSVSHSQNTD